MIELAFMQVSVSPPVVTQSAVQAASDVAQGAGLLAPNAVLTLEVVCGYAVCLFLGLLAATLLGLLWKGRINLYGLISEANGQASASRLQLLIFSLVIALALFLLTIKDGRFPEISPQLLLLLGISASTYAVGKGISYSQPEVLTAPGEQKTVKEISATGAASVATKDGVAAEGAPVPQGTHRSSTLTGSTPDASQQGSCGG